ncbi:hypothetical protein KXR87_09630 [Yokenella regensburgei]|uniref:hypothetical protein n=1 Tax=Yokenella regensburgei TaxID=158877 RepID=UPI003F15A094
MKVLTVIGAALLATSFQTAAFVSQPSVHAALALSAGNDLANGQAPSGKVNYGEVAKLIPVVGCNCVFCCALRSASS